MGATTSAGTLGANLAKGTLAEREAVAKQICDLAGSMPERRELLAVAGVIPRLVALISEASSKGKEWSAAALGHLALHPDNKSKIVEAGAIEVLIQLGKNGSPGAKGAVATALSSLASRDSENQTKIAEAGAFPVLVDMVRNKDGAMPAKAQAWAAACVGNLTLQHPANQDLAAECGVIEALVDFLKAYASVKSELPPGSWWAWCRACQKRADTDDSLGAMTDKGKEWILKALSSLGWKHVSNQARIGEAGALNAMVELMKDGPSSTSLKFEAGKAISNMVAKCLENRPRAVEAGIVPILDAWIKSRASMIRSEIATGLIGTLASGNKEIQDKICATGVVPELAWLLHAGDDTTKLHTAMALTYLSEDNPPNRVLIGQAGCILGLVKLSEAGLPQTRNFATKALVSLATDNEENKQMIESYEVNLPKSNGLAGTGMKLCRVADSEDTKVSDKSEAILDEVVETADADGCNQIRRRQQADGSSVPGAGDVE
eukprot:TRINITY_DN61486_c0_g1_i1.p1 TRINITY_DN61486_c0_g1~~TRINITY_DN61486_c0_g1_i1.p1  ORF type:complete len:490 (+),score=105.55 TRINITY_DN61486_c0_g1_i1:76-1545(+)